ncbi:MAG: hypothetical protein WEC83_02090 [Patescibacteria group bacterium]
MLKTLYVIAIGLLFAGVVGFGFSAFYPAPQYPETPVELRYPSVSGELTDQQKAAQEKYDAESKMSQDSFEDYNRNISIGLIIVAMITLSVSIMGLGKIEMIGDGLTLGGVFTLLYGLGRAMAAGDEKIRFFAVLFGLAVLLFLTYWKYLRGQKNSPVL